MEESRNERLKRVLDEAKVPHEEVGKILKRKRNTITERLNDPKKQIDSYDFIKAVSLLTGKSVDWLFNGIDLNEESNIVHEPLPKINTHKRIPFYDVDAEGGAGGADVSPVSQASGTIEIGDLLKDSEAAMRISGNSMIPNYPPGCVVGLIRRYGPSIEPGEVYVVETRDGRILKRLFYKDDVSGGDHFTCFSDNTMTFANGPRNGKAAYPPFDLSREEIIAIYTVVGVIKRNTNSMIVHKK